MAARKVAAKPNISPEELLGYYKDMLLIRRFEEKAGQLYGMGLIGGFCHLYIGQEAVVVGLEAAAAMHMFSKEKHFYGGHGIVGAQVPLGAGLAFADKYLDNGRVTFAYFGDGAANQGQIYETFNMAALWDLPVIFVIENNQYAMGTAQKRSTSTPDLYTRGEAFGIKGQAVDGMDVLEVKAAGEKAVAHCRSGKGPYILEIKTYRYRGHSMSDPAKYRTREEVQKMREERDAIESVRSLLLTGKHTTEEALKAIDKDVKDIVNASAEFAKTSPEPDLDELWTDIYA